ncbi:unnamed protein product [Boreogadus saida]
MALTLGLESGDLMESFVNMAPVQGVIRGLTGDWAGLPPGRPAGAPAPWCSGAWCSGAWCSGALVLRRLGAPAPWCSGALVLRRLVLRRLGAPAPGHMASSSAARRSKSSSLPTGPVVPGA